MPDMNPLKATLTLLLGLGLLLGSAEAQRDPRSFAAPLSPRTASYDIALNLDTEKHQVKATQVLTFTNPSEDTIWTLQFHLYYNAFRNNRSTFVAEGGVLTLSMSEEDLEKGRWAWIKVTEAKDSRGRDLSRNMRYIRPDDGNPNDYTVLEIPLAEPVLPYQSCRLEMKWQSQIPKLMIRTGYNRDFYFMAQWFPKLGVYEPAGTRFAEKGAWNCHQYHSNTEYYGEFGVYKVAITAPSEYVVGASGFLLDQKKQGNNTTHIYLAEDVIDFTWAACPHFVEVKDKWQGTDIRLLIMPEHLHQKERFLQPAKNTLSFFASYLEPYPYPTLTIVSPPYYGLMCGAMEYPTLITSATLSALPPGIRTTETLVTHELTHQYFMQMLASNEQEEPWMDEGFTAFFEGKIMDRYLPEGVVAWDRMGLHIGSEEFRRGRFFEAENPQVNPLSDFGWEFRHGSYSPIVYGKAAVALNTLEGLLGEATMQAIMQTYFARWKFKHPGRQDFIDVVNEVVQQRHGDQFGSDMNWFLEPVIFGTEMCDYSVASISNTLMPEPLGIFEEIDKPLLPEEEQPELYRSKVVLYRLGGLVIPQEIKVVFDDGEVVLANWDGQARSHELVYTGEKQVLSAFLDSDWKTPLDKNRINNSYTLEPDKTGLQRTCAALLSWLQAAMLSLSLLL